MTGDLIQWLRLLEKTTVTTLLICCVVMVPIGLEMRELILISTRGFLAFLALLETYAYCE